MDYIALVPGPDGYLVRDSVKESAMRAARRSRPAKADWLSAPETSGTKLGIAAMSMPDAIEEMIKVSAMYGLCSIGAVARFTGAVLRGDKPAARVLWGW